MSSISNAHFESSVSNMRMQRFPKIELLSFSSQSQTKRDRFERKKEWIRVSQGFQVGNKKGNANETRSSGQETWKLSCA
jgi:hypothetical protein